MGNKTDTTDENCGEAEEEATEPEIVLRMDDDDADMVEDVLAEGGIKSDVIRRA